MTEFSTEFRNGVGSDRTAGRAAGAYPGERGGNWRPALHIADSRATGTATAGVDPLCNYGGLGRRFWAGEAVDDSELGSGRGGVEPAEEGSTEVIAEGSAPRSDRAA